MSNEEQLLSEQQVTEIGVTGFEPVISRRDSGLTSLLPSWRPRPYLRQQRPDIL